MKTIIKHLLLISIVTLLSAGCAAIEINTHKVDNPPISEAL